MDNSLAKWLAKPSCVRNAVVNEETGEIIEKQTAI